ncbi:MAG: Teneurin-2, partial [Nitrospinae bacterium]|nr:Teneurin-2 [Nitrospinota bacterium]
MDKNGIITTIAGKRGVGGFIGDGGPAKDSRLNYPRDVALDKLG